MGFETLSQSWVENKAMDAAFRRVGIWGVGLIGGSLGLAIKRCHPHTHLLGIGRDPGRLEVACRMGAIDAWRIESEADLAGCDLLVLATPVDHILQTLASLGSRLSPGTLVTDVGSTKRRICLEAWKRLPAGIQFIGGHPVAGRENYGVENSTAGLFEGAPYVFCPEAQSGSAGLDRLLELAKRLGARPLVMSADNHDRAIATVSHLPQLLSTALANAVGEASLAIAGSGFRDMTRLAGSPYSLWDSILETNRDNVDRALEEFIVCLGKIRSALREGRLSEQFALASEIYRKTRSGPGFPESR